MKHNEIARPTLDGNLEGFFREVVEETCSHVGQTPDDHLKEYMVGLLEDSAVDDSIVAPAVDRPLALFLADAMAAAPSERFQRLRKAGDGILLVGGLYRKHLRRVGVGDDYVVTLGRHAYHSASSLLEVPSGALVVGTDSSFDILRDLAIAFGQLMDFLRALSDILAARAAKSVAGIAHLYETWLTDRSAHLERLLRAHGVILDRRSPAVN